MTCGLSKATRPCAPGLTAVFLGLVVCLQCTPQIRYANRLPGDPFFEWSRPERSRLRPSELLEETESAQGRDDLNDRALAFAATERPDRAERIFYDILRLYPRDLRSYRNLMRLYVLLEKPGKLTRLARRLILQSGRSSKALLAEAEGLANRNRTAEARALYRALFTEKRAIAAGLWLGADRIGAGDDAAARDYYEAVLGLQPGNQEALFMLGWLYARLPHDKTALAYLDAAYRAGYRSTRLSLLRARLYERLGKDKKALAVLAKTPRTLRTLPLIRLQGHLLLKAEPARDLRFLTRGLPKKKAEELLTDWYGSPDFRQYHDEILPEFMELY